MAIIQIQKHCILWIIHLTIPDTFFSKIFPSCYQIILFIYYFKTFIFLLYLPYLLFLMLKAQAVCDTSRLSFSCLQNKGVGSLVVILHSIALGLREFTNILSHFTEPDVDIRL